MAWQILFLAAFFEILWATGLKFTDGLSKPLPTLLCFIALMLSVGLLAIAAKNLEIGTAYAVWTGIGATGTVILSFFLLGEALPVSKLFFIVLIITGVIGLKFTTN